MTHRNLLHKLQSFQFTDTQQKHPLFTKTQNIELLVFLLHKYFLNNDLHIGFLKE